MKTVIKLAVGAAIAGLLVNLLLKRQSSERLQVSKQDRGDPRPAEDFTPQQQADENAEWGGGSSGLNS